MDIATIDNLNLFIRHNQNLFKFRNFVNRLANLKDQVVTTIKPTVLEKVFKLKVF